MDLYWLPLGAGGHSVRWNGRVFEAVAPRLQHRPVCALYHSALVVYLPAAGRFVIEQAPVPDSHGEQRGVVKEGAVGARWAGRARIFRYEVRRWRNGTIPDMAEAVESPQRLTADPVVTRRLWECVADLPTPVWGRDDFGAGEMWNSNSVIAWLITRSGLAVESVRLPVGGRAPGWNAGIVVARRFDTLMARGASEHTGDRHMEGGLHHATVSLRTPPPKRTEHAEPAYADAIVLGVALATLSPTRWMR